MPPEAPSPFALRIQALEEGASRHELVGTAADLDIDPAYARLEGPVRARLHVFRSGEKIEVQGELEGELNLRCDRCLAPIRRAIRAEIRVFAERRESRDRRSREEVREDDLGIVYHDGRLVDLTDEVRQLFLVEVPWHVLCREDCAGLCPRCGFDRNAGPCSCEAGGRDAQDRRV